MSNKSDRRIYEKSAKNLRRARRLYGALTAATILAQPEAAIPLAYKAKAAGLYSEKTAMSDVIFSLCRHAYRHKRSRDKGEWWHWAKTDGKTPWQNHSDFYRMNGNSISVKKKPRFRVTTRRAA